MRSMLSRRINLRGNGGRLCSGLALWNSSLIRLDQWTYYEADDLKAGLNIWRNV